MKLGEILIETGLLTESQLEKALKAQLILGGHLGTNLIELGFVDEETLGKVLSKTCGVPYAPPKLFASIPDATIKAVPEKVAEEYQVVPIMLTEQAVHLALVNPRDLRVLDELSFAIGRRIIPWIAPEVRIFQALERYYAVGRRPRYITLGHQLDEAGERSRSGTGDACLTLVGAERSPVGDLPEGQFLSEERHDIEAGYGRPWQEVAEELENRESAAAAAVPPKRPSSSMPLSELAERYCRAETHDDLALAALEFGVGRADRMLFLIVSADRASVWHERGLGPPNETREEVSFQVTSEALFGLLMGDDHYHGDLPPRDELKSFYRRLGVDTPGELLLVPIRVNDLLVAVVLADGGPKGRIHGEVEEFLKAFRLFGMSLGLLALRKKIRDAARPVTRVVV
jgi:hypothetical protein